MLCCPQRKGWNYFQTEGTKLLEKKLANSTLDTFQRKHENFD